MPREMLNGKVMASAIGTYNPGLALGAASFMAAGTAMYEALAARIENIKRLEGSLVTRLLMSAAAIPFISGITIAKTTVNQP